MTHEIDVVDIFAGPGGLGEGFAGFCDTAGHYPFQLLVSAEMDSAAHSTLSLRSLYRACRREGGVRLRQYFKLLNQSTDARESAIGALAAAGPLANLWLRVGVEVQRIVLGTESGNHDLHRRIRANARRSRRPLVLIGGPPCQAYSVVGRVRNRGNRNYRPEDDNRHFLYREYLKILTEFEPDIFVMENVMGLLSSRVGGQWIVEKILRDLRNPSGKVRKRLKGAAEEYVLIPLTPSVGGLHVACREADPMEFVVRAEQHGIPQTRHRVIILGVHRSVARRLTNIPRLPPLLAGPVTAGNVLIDLPRVRSGLSERTDSTTAWYETVEHERKRLVKLLRRLEPEMANVLSHMCLSPRLGRSARTYRDNPAKLNPLAQHYRGGGLDLLFNHDTRTHMDADLGRYLFCAVFAALFDRSPGSADFPAELAPNHKSWAAGHFRDRFRVQTANRPGSTVTSHLAKDGHHFIHWDASQCRSLTVREAARIQSFPDDYIFLGSRTQQYTQVGNAVPPLLARQIAAIVADIFY